MSILLIAFLVFIFIGVLVWYLNSPSPNPNNNYLENKDTKYNYKIFGPPTKYENVYFYIDGKTPLYLYWKIVEVGHILALTSHKNLASKFTLNFFNPEFVKPYYLKTFRFDNDSEDYIKERKLDRIVYITSDVPSKILYEVIPYAAKWNLAARIHMCGSHGYVTIDKDKSLQFDGYNDKDKKRYERVEFNIECENNKDIDKNFARLL